MTEPTDAQTGGAAAGEPAIDDLEQRAAALAEEPQDLRPFTDAPNGSVGPDDPQDSDTTVDITSPQAVPQGKTMHQGQGVPRGTA